MFDRVLNTPLFGFAWVMSENCLCSWIWLKLASHIMIVHAKTRNELEQSGTTLNGLERAGTTKNELEPTRASWNKIDLAKISKIKSYGSSLQWPCIRKNIWSKRIITKTRRASSDTEFWIHSRSSRLTELSEFLFNTLIVKFCWLANGLYI